MRGNEYNIRKTEGEKQEEQSKKGAIWRIWNSDKYSRQAKKI